ncbi:hypothetical protein EDEG_00842 [Edhazardia aedis USNM 41457]|uniref:Uncharacterized protein n=1 Tax=Edhazardia aedis (strain USNM 41457) TaxID=1003232 RepID=J9DBG9_EDHAE|nr:hypothetical protein EDEG_00842 [Edhazardia aedis USNM 41457]|eukprot:EJW05061.1 hypothetical protein EDEG_00842 [Edhazardia aedis USNM 41457]
MERLFCVLVRIKQDLSLKWMLTDICYSYIIMYKQKYTNGKKNKDKISKSYATNFFWVKTHQYLNHVYFHSYHPYLSKRSMYHTVLHKTFYWNKKLFFIIY